MAPGLVSEGFLIDPPECFPLFLHGLLWGLPNRQETKGGGVLTLMSFLGTTPILNNLRRDWKVQRFILWCQTRNYLLSFPKRSSVDHRLNISSLARSAPMISFSTSYKLERSWDVILVGVRRYSTVYRVSSCPRFQIFQVSPQEASLIRSPRVENWV